MPYKPFTLENLREVRQISFDGEHGLISLSTGTNGDVNSIINVGEGEWGDDKTIGFDHASFMFLLRIMTEITGRKFEEVQRRNCFVLYQSKD